MVDAEQEEVGAVIVAAGKSQRMSGTDKIFAPLAGQPVLLRVLQPFIDCASVDRIVVVLNGRNYDEGKELIAAQNWDKEVAVCIGGKRRQDSVLAGLKLLGDCDWVIIQDGARPLVTENLIESGLEAAKETGAAIAAMPATDTIKIADKELIAHQTLHRDSLWLCQTPQVFRYDLLVKAYREATDEVTDDAQIVELTGGKVKLYMGSYDNIKITTPADLTTSEMFLKRRKG
ncbi:MAG: 2-C-methyl-D-erythritol 4-phosphate cytidylyltransferase [Dehalococcoidales bacterium]|nr:2-C-methyl-D-erythritol 4-phosphate cytidylyltransferase [Dehalococcoidales bacterium]